MKETQELGTTQFSITQPWVPTPGSDSRDSCPVLEKTNWARKG